MRVNAPLSPVLQQWKDEQQGHGKAAEAALSTTVFPFLAFVLSLPVPLARFFFSLSLSPFVLWLPVNRVVAAWCSCE